MKIKTKIVGVYIKLYMMISLTWVICEEKAGGEMEEGSRKEKYLHSYRQLGPGFK